MSVEHASVQLSSSTLKRFAYRFTPTVIKALLPERSIGTYLLLDGDTPVYVGRSDHCLRQRLSTHNHLRAATHVTWELTRTPGQAFILEAYLFHRYKDLLINKIHPAIPTNSSTTCPFCAPNVEKALARALKLRN